MKRRAFVSHITLGLVRLSLVLTLALGMLLSAISAFAQLPTGTIIGTVKDSSGGTMPDAQVTVTNTETNESRSTTTAGDGLYRFPALQPGRYSLKVEKSGFKTATQAGLNLDVAQDLVVNTTLEVGATTQEVTVTTEVPQVNTTSSSLGGLVSDQQMADLPLNGRNFVDLAVLQPGVTNDTNFQNVNGQGGNWGVMFSSNGAPVRSNTFTLDGAPMMNIHGNTGGAIGTTLGVDGIKEYKVITDAFSAEYGLQMGSQVVIVSKGGTNQFHGDVFEYLRNSVLDSRNWFDYSYLTTGKRIPELQRNNFGGSFGGPIRKNKTFFYGVYEGLRQNMGATIIDNVFPANCHVATANPCAISATNPKGNVAPVMLPILALYPSPNLPNSIQFTFPALQPSTVNYGQMRIDQTLSSSDSFFGRYTVQDSNNTNAYVYPQFRLLTTGRDQFFTLSENHIFSSALLNTARISYSRTNLAQNSLYPSFLVGPQYSLVTGQPIGQLIVNGVTNFGPTGNAPYLLLQNLYTLSDDVYYTKGRHAFKFGALFNRFENYDLATTNLRGNLTFNTQANFMAGIFTTGTFLTGPVNKETRFYTYGMYAQDDWRVTPRLTLNLGLRYEFSTVPYDRLGRNYAFLNFATDATTTLGYVLQNASLHNFGPRIGFAWDVRGNGRTSIRAAFGEYYDLANNGFVIYSAQGTPPLYGLITPAAPKTALTLPVVSSGTIGNSLHTQEYLDNQPRLLQWNLTIEQQLARNLSLSLSYVGTRGIHLWDNEEGNPCIPTSITNGIPFWAVDCGKGRLNPLWGSNNYEATNGDSNFHSLQAVVTQRLSHGLALGGAYTYGKVLDDVQGQFGPSDCQALGGSNGVNPLNRRYDKGPSCFDVTHNVRVNLLYHFPIVNTDNAVARGVLGGWWLGTIASWETGFPFTPMLTSWRSQSDHLFAANSNGTTDRASLGTATVAPGQVGPDGTVNTTKNTFIPFDESRVITGNPKQWFNPLMFTPGPVGFLGTAGRDMLRGPHLSNVDFSLNKDTAVHFLGEAGQVQFRAEFFNIFNHPNFGIPVGNTFSGAVTDKSEFVENPANNSGSITNTVTTSRQIQVSLKVIF